MRLRQNDNVLVIRGRDRGKTGRISTIFTKEDKILVEGINVVLRHQKASGSFRQSGIIQKEIPMRATNVMVICTSCIKPTRIGMKFLADGTKARMCKKCGEIIE